MIDIREGQFVVVPGYSTFTAKVVKADAVTPKLIKSARSWGKGFGHTDRESAFAAYDSQEEAERLVSTIAGIRGEYQRRTNAAAEAAREQMRRAIEKAQASIDAKVSAE